MTLDEIRNRLDRIENLARETYSEMLTDREQEEAKTALAHERTALLAALETLLTPEKM